MRLLSVAILLMVAATISAARVQGADEGEKVPHPKEMMPIEYPPLAAMANITGTAVLRISIDKDGNVSGVDTVSGHPLNRPSKNVFEMAFKFKLKGATEASHRRVKTTYKYPGGVTVTTKAPYVGT